MKRVAVAATVSLIAACGGGDTGGGCGGACAEATEKLSAADVEQVLAQGVAEAQARGAAATLAVVDRSGNVLAVFRMNGADVGITVDSGRGVAGGLEGISDIPDTTAAIAKAVTGA